MWSYRDRGKLGIPKVLWRVRYPVPLTASVSSLQSKIPRLDLHHPSIRMVPDDPLHPVGRKPFPNSVEVARNGLKNCLSISHQFVALAFLWITLNLWAEQFICAIGRNFAGMAPTRRPILPCFSMPSVGRFKSHGNPNPETIQPIDWFAPFWNKNGMRDSPHRRS